MAKQKPKNRSLVSVSKPTRVKLGEIAEKTNKTMTETVEVMVNKYEKELIQK